jgi:hypothetical protein
LKFHGLRHTDAALLLYGRFIPAGIRSVVDALDDVATGRNPRRNQSLSGAVECEEECW